MRARRALRLIRALFCMLLALGATTAFAAKRRELRFKIVDVKQPAFVLSPYRAQWRVLAPGQGLGEGDILQVGIDGSVVIAMPNLAGVTGVASRDVRLTISEPTIVRLEADLFRKVDRRVLVAPEPKKEQEPKAEGEEPNLVFDLMDAWYRRVSLAFKKRQGGGPTEENKSATLAARAKPIRVYVPQPESMILTDTFPHELRVMWRAVPADPGREPTYGVSVWPADKELRGAAVTTRETSASVAIPGEGRYFVQVKTRDGSAQSPPISFNVVRPLSLAAMTSVHPKKTKKDYSKLVLEKPSDGFTIVAVKDMATVDFVWKVVDPDERQSRHRLRVFDAAGKMVIDKTTDDTQARVDIPAHGRYTWRIESFMEPLNKGGTVGTARSEARSLRFKRPSRMVETLDLLGAAREVTVVIEAL